MKHEECYLGGIPVLPLFWFSVKMRVNLTEEGFRPAGGDFQGMRIYRSDVFFFVSFWGGEFHAAHD
jgi:hypothetical protein